MEDAAEGIALATERYDGSEPANLGTGEEISIRDLAQMIADEVGFTGRIRLGCNEARRPTSSSPGYEQGSTVFRVPGLSRDRARASKRHWPGPFLLIALNVKKPLSAKASAEPRPKIAISPKEHKGKTFRT